MQIEVAETPEGIHGDREVWVTVLSDTAVDWPTVQKALEPDQKKAMWDMESTPCSYFPGDEPGWRYADTWVFRHRRNAH